MCWNSASSVVFPIPPNSPSYMGVMCACVCSMRECVHVCVCWSPASRVTILHIPAAYSSSLFFQTMSPNIQLFCVCACVLSLSVLPFFSPPPPCVHSPLFNISCCRAHIYSELSLSLSSISSSIPAIF